MTEKEEGGMKATPATTRRCVETGSPRNSHQNLLTDCGRRSLGEIVGGELVVGVLNPKLGSFHINVRTKTTSRETMPDMSPFLEANWSRTALGRIGELKKIETRPTKANRTQ